MNNKTIVLSMLMSVFLLAAHSSDLMAHGAPKKGKHKITQEEFARILDGCADYCAKLKAHTFDYQCTEEVLETLKPLTGSASRINPKTGKREFIKYSERLQKIQNVQKPVTWGKKTSVAFVDKYLFSYRMIKGKYAMRELRQWLTPKEERHENLDKDDVVRGSSFYSEWAIYTPASMLAKDRQARFRYRFEGYETLESRKCAIIRGIPIDSKTTLGFHGRAWIDLEDFSVLKISADPKSINNYAIFKQSADNLNTRLHLTLEMDFGHLREGIRYPTRLFMLEIYRGGTRLSRLKPGGWERTRTEITYSDYRFLDK